MTQNSGHLEISKRDVQIGRTLAAWEHSGAFPAVSIIVLNYGSTEATIDCLASISHSDYQGPIQVVLVDNGSTIDSAAALRSVKSNFPRNVEMITSEKNLGFAGGVLAAWPHTEGDLVCLLNNDALLHPNCVTTLVEGIRGRSTIGAVWPYDAPAAWFPLLQEPAESEVAAMKNGTHSIIGANIWIPLLKDYRQCFTGSGVCILFPKSEVDTPFPNEYFAYYEDVFLGWNLQLKGLKVERVPEAIVYHIGSATTTKNPELRPLLSFHAEKNRIANLLLFYDATTLVRVFPLLLLSEFTKFSAAVFSLIAFNPTRIRVYLKSRIWLLSHAGWLSLMRGKIQSVRKIPDASLVSLMSGRFTMKTGRLASFANLVSLAYCRLVGLITVELQNPQ
jgi:GT2 family glycosyltransferase